MLEDSLIRLLDYDRREFWLSNGWSLRFRIRRVARSEARPHGIKYSFTLHDEAGERLLGYDNAHGFLKGTAWDHQHRFRKVWRLEPYFFSGYDMLLADFFGAVEASCQRDGVDFTFVEETINLEDDDDDATEEPA